MGATRRLWNKCQASVLCDSSRTVSGKSLQLIWSRPPKEAQSVQAQPAACLIPLVPSYQIATEMGSRCIHLCILGLSHPRVSPCGYLVPPTYLQTAFCFFSFDPA